MCNFYTPNTKFFAMNKFYTLILSIVCSTAGIAQPVVDGVINAGEGYTVAATADATPGWAGAHAKKIHFAEDATYFYFAVEVSADSWMSYGMIFNTKSGGGSTDGWARQINYSHADKPDYELRGNFSGGYAEFHTWSGTAWTGGGTSIGSNVVANNAVVEFKLAKTSFGAIGSMMDVQFYITGDNNDHGSFDAIPNDNNAAGWGPPQSVTNLSQYAPIASLLPYNKLQLSGNLRNSEANIALTVKNGEYAKFELEKSADGKNWTAVAEKPFQSEVSLYNFSTVQNEANAQYRIKAFSSDGNFIISNVVVLIKKSASSVELLGNPVYGNIRFSYSSAEAAKIVFTLYSVEGRQIVSSQFTHTGASHLYELPLKHTKKGIYFAIISIDGMEQVMKVVVD